MRVQVLVQYAAYVAVRLFICVLQAIPIEMCHTLTRGLAWFCNDIVGVRRKVVLDNLRQAFPELTEAQRRQVSRRMWQHLLLFVVELAHAPRKIHDSNWRDYVKLVDPIQLLEALLSDRPVTIVSGHFGNFELAGYIIGLLGFPTHTVARKLDNPFLDRFLNRFRGVTGQYMIPKKGGYDQIVEVMSSKGTMTFLADQHAGEKGCWVDFFGREASTHKAIALLAMQHDSPVAVGYAVRGDRPLQYSLRCEDIAEPSEYAGVKELTAWYTNRIEDAIRRAPDQYWWLHRRWKERRKRRPSAARKQAA